MTEHLTGISNVNNVKMVHFQNSYKFTQLIIHSINYLDQ